MAEGEKKLRIGNWTALAMIAVAVLCDGLQLLATFFHAIPVLGTAVALGLTWFIAMFAFILFGVWFVLHGVWFFKGKQAALKILTVFGSVVTELIPFIDALPVIVGGVITMIVITRIEDTTGVSASAARKGAVIDSQRAETARRQGAAIARYGRMRAEQERRKVEEFARRRGMPERPSNERDYRAQRAHRERLGWQRPSDTSKAASDAEEAA